MHIILVGLNYKTAPVEMREKVAFQETELPAALKQLRVSKSILECVIITTCNRTEVYVVADQLHTGRHFTKTFLSDWFNISKEEITPYLQIKENDVAVEHLMRVSAGLDSMILGETQILGQIKNQFLLAQNEQVTGTIFNELFKQAITFAKKAHSLTDISQQAVSVSYAGVELGKRIFGSFHEKNVLVLGAGKMSELTAKHLHSNGAAEITVINRTEEKAKELASRFSGTARPFNELADALTSADVFISSTGSRDFVVTKQDVALALKKRKGRPLFIVDIAVPRDIDPAIADFDDVYLYDIDDLQNIVESNLAERQKEAEKIELLIEAELVQFNQWLTTLGVVPVITALRSKALAVQADTMESIERKLPHLSERDRKVLRKHTKSIVNQLLRDPITRIKEMAGEGESDESLDLVTKMFALEMELAEQEKQACLRAAEDHWEQTKQLDYAAVSTEEKAVVRS
ncbi:glutamyl-tRNA reductase [Alkalicoccobacillus murimartini]|uniref:Glutamyl-tRNA reductase n=1 Tax=Alkalicoccobacillus murimartini TaxID=171685 RepID=A0ABT9YKK9_9BACI|nr:glutamyl-tRNA reductase [Alkalicoccobacillus murimartini]MDQ0208021.1 glutamyl-tRNA reductase [Alkalicoccobacillus murimartini]